MLRMTKQTDYGFVLLTAHTPSLGPDRLSEALAAAFGPAGAIETGTLGVDSEAGGRLELGAFARWDGRR